MTWDTRAALANRVRPLSAILLDCNSAGTEQTWTGLPAKYRIVSLYGYDASATPALATVGLFTATGGGGTTVCAATLMTTLTAATKLLNASLAGVTGTDYFTAGTLFLRNVVAQGTALTVRFTLTIQEME